jgi:hypothetical protein
MTIFELREIDAEVDAINARQDTLNPENWQDSYILDQLDARLCELQSALEESLKARHTKRKAKFTLIPGGKQ